MATPKQPRKITIVGGTGTVGKPILDALLATGIHTLSAITRPGSQGAFPARVTVHRGAYDDEAFLAASLSGQDVLILALSYSAYEAQRPLIRAAAAAGVPYVVPCEFGSDATGDAPLNAETDLMNAKRPYRDLVEALGVSAWIGVTNNPWFDHCLRAGLLDVDLRGRTAKLLDGGRARANFTTLARVGASLAALLGLPGPELAAHANRWVYFSSFLVSQRDVLESALRATGTREEDWVVTGHRSEDVIARCREQVAQGNAMAGAMSLFAFLFTEGFGGNYERKVVDYERLGLEREESLDEVMKSLVEELGA